MDSATCWTRDSRDGCDERRRAVPRRKLLPLGGQRSGDSRKRGGTSMTAVPPAVLVLGGSGFVGRHIVNRLVSAGRRVVVPTRRRDNARHLILLPTVDVIEADIHDPPTLGRLVAGSSAVINLVGILNETRGASFARVHVELTRRVIAACQAANV